MKENFPDISGDCETRELTIKAVGARGDGISPSDSGSPVFVPFTLPGERVRVTFEDKTPGPIEVLTPSPDRRAPACRHFTVCGGCALQHWKDAPYRAWKRELVVEALARTGVEASVGDLIDATGSGRRRATFHAVRAKSIGFAFGFARRASHDVFDLEECPVLAPQIVAAVPDLRRLAEALLPRSGRLDIAVTVAKEGLDVDVRGGGGQAGRSKGRASKGKRRGRGGPGVEANRARLDGDMLLRASEIAAGTNWARLTLADEPALVRAVPTVDISGVPVRVPPATFLQATHDGEEVLGSLILDAAQGARRVADLYSGVGTFALRLAKSTAVTAVEGDAQAVDALRNACDHNTGLKPITTLRRDLAREPLITRELADFDVVVLDPPRTGAAAQVEELANSEVTRVIMVSCAPPSFARDAATLIAGGYKLEGVAVVDQFLWSPHVEIVGMFRR